MQIAVSFFVVNINQFTVMSDIVYVDFQPHTASQALVNTKWMMIHMWLVIHMLNHGYGILLGQLDN